MGLVQQDMKDRLYELLYMAHEGKLTMLTIIGSTADGEIIHHQIKVDSPPFKPGLRLVSSV